MIVSTTAVGSLNTDFAPGHFVLVDQFLDFTKSRVSTFFDGNGKKVVHLGVGNPYSPALRKVIMEAASELNIDAHNGGTYVCTEGPRFETPAEIKDVQNAGRRYGGHDECSGSGISGRSGNCLCYDFYGNQLAAGISPTELTHQEVLDIMAEMSDKFKA